MCKASDNIHIHLNCDILICEPVSHINNLLKPLHLSLLEMLSIMSGLVASPLVADDATNSAAK